MVAHHPLPENNELEQGKHVEITETGSPPRHFRAFLIVLVGVMLIGLAWVVEIDALLMNLREDSVQLHVKPVNTLPDQATRSTNGSEELVATPKPTNATKKCEHLGHRDPGFVRADTKSLCFSERELIELLRDIVFTAANIFEAYNLTYFLESGSLLGSYREKGVIHHDQDADFGIDPATLAFIRENPIEVPEGYHLAVWNSSVHGKSSRDPELPVRLIHKETALYADMFNFLDWKNDEVGPLPSSCFWACRACPVVRGYRHFKVPRGWVYPLVDCPFEGRSLKCPREPAKYLEHLYGRTYMIPQRS